MSTFTSSVFWCWYFNWSKTLNAGLWLLHCGSTGCTKVKKDLSSQWFRFRYFRVRWETITEHRGPSECFGTLLQWLTSRATIYFDLKYQHVPTETMSFNRTEFGLVFCKESCSWYYTYHVKLLENVSAKQRLSLVIRERLFNVFVLSFRCFF